MEQDLLLVMALYMQIISLWFATGWDLSFPTGFLKSMSIPGEESPSSLYTVVKTDHEFHQALSTSQTCSSNEGELELWLQPLNPDLVQTNRISDNPKWYQGLHVFQQNKFINLQSSTSTSYIYSRGFSQGF